MYAKCLNNDNREKLCWRSAFEVYYGRKSNELVKFGVPLIEKMNRKNLYMNVKDVLMKKEKRQKTLIKNLCRIVEYNRKTGKCPQYRNGEDLIIRY